MVRRDMIARVLNIPMFAPWRRLWDESLSARGQSLDDLVRRRNESRDSIDAGLFVTVVADGGG